MKEYNIKNTTYKMRYNDFQGKKTPIIFIHGLGCAGSIDYPEVASEKCLSEHRRILIDLLGSGYSDKPEEFSYSVKDHAGYLKEFIEDSGFEKVIIYGHSLGGPVAMELAAELKDKVETLILCESNLDSSTEGSTSFEIGSCSEEDFVNEGYYTMLTAAMEDNTMWSASFSNCLPTAMYRISRNACEGGNPSWRELLYSLKCRRVFIFGEKSLPDKDFDILKNHGLEMKIVEKAGHSMAWENPKGLAETIAASL